MSPSVSIGRAPAKLILFGEHAVGYGQPALGVALGRGVETHLRVGHGRVRTTLPEGIEAPSSASTTPSMLFRAALGDRADTLDAELDIGVPPQAGLGTSAAVTVSLLRALATLDDRSVSQDALFDQAMNVEHLAHGKSSGLDPALCIHGGQGMLAFRKAEPKPTIEIVRLETSFHLVVAARRSHGGTEPQVRRVADLHERSPALAHAALELLGEASRSGRRALETSDLTEAGRAMDLAHGVLSGIGLVGEEVDGLVRSCRRLGALGAKMSGAGGPGGAFFALAPDIKVAQTISDALEASGAIAWVETIA